MAERLIIDLKRTVSLDCTIKPESLTGTLCGGEKEAHRFIVRATKGGLPVTLSGTVTGECIRWADNITLPLTGEIVDGAAALTLDESCYAYDGSIRLTIYVSSGGSKTTIYTCDAEVRQTNTGTYSDPGTIMASFDQLIADIAAARADMPVDYTALKDAIAKVYSDEATYNALRYVWYNATLNRSLFPISTAEAWDANHWTAIDIATELEMILAVLQGLRPGKALAFSTSNGTVALNVGVGNTVNLTPSSTGSYKYIVEPCKQGDVFKLTSSINATHTVRAWGFVDEDDKLVSVCKQGTSVTDIHLIAPCDGHFVAHTLGSTSASAECVRHGAEVTIGRLTDAETAITTLQNVATAILAEAARDEAAANGTYPGRDLTQIFLEEIGGYDDEWQWLHARIQAGNFAGIRIGDYIPVTCSNGFQFNARVAGVNTYKGSGSSSVPNHIDFFGDKGWPVLVKMNPADNNNGVSGRSVPFMASNAYYYLNSEAGSVPNSATAPTETVDVDYTADGVYYNLPAALKAVITAKRVNTTGRYSATGLVDSGRTSASIVIGKLWLPFEPEVSGCAAIGNLRDAACGLMRYPLFQNWPGASIGRASDDIYWLASAAEGETAGFVVVRRYGDMAIRTATTESKLPICFRVT